MTDPNRQRLQLPPALSQQMERELVDTAMAHAARRERITSQLGSASVIIPNGHLTHAERLAMRARDDQARDR